MGIRKLIFIFWTLLLLQLTTARTVQHTRTTINGNGEREIKTWTTTAEADSAETTDAEGFQTFTRDGVTLRMKPRTQTIRIGGQNVPNEQIIEQAGLMNSLEQVAVRQLLQTRQPVTRTSFADDVKTTSVYSLEPDGGIKCTIVSDIDPKEVEAAFEEITRRRKQQQPPVEHELIETRKSTVQRPQNMYGGINFEHSPASSYPRLPSVWDPNQWPRHDPFNPPELAESSQHTPQTPSRSMSNKHNSPPSERTHLSSPGQDSFWKPTYESTTVPTRTINVNDLPIMTVLNSGQPLDEHYLRHYPAELMPSTGERPLKTLKIDNIPQTPDIETTNVKSITRTLTSDHIPTQAELDPSMQDILRRAGINPAEAEGAENNTITRVRVEPDGRVVKTTYRVRKLPASAPFNFDTNRGYASAPNSGFDSEWLKPFSQKPGNSFSGSQQGVDFPSYGLSITTPAHEFDDDEVMGTAKTLNPLHVHNIESDKATGQGSSAIAEYLERVGLRVEDIERNDGEFTKTIVDKDGRTMRVKFVLSPKL